MQSSNSRVILKSDLSFRRDNFRGKFIFYKTKDYTMVLARVDFHNDPRLPRRYGFVQLGYPDAKPTFISMSKGESVQKALNVGAEVFITTNIKHLEHPKYQGSF